MFGFVQDMFRVCLVCLGLFRSCVGPECATAFPPTAACEGFGAGAPETFTRRRGATFIQSRPMASQEPRPAQTAQRPVYKSPPPPQTRATERPRSPDLLKLRTAPYTNLLESTTSPNSRQMASHEPRPAQTARSSVYESPPPPQTRAAERPRSPDLLKPRTALYTNLYHLPNRGYGTSRRPALSPALR